jgi:hypothetical protein
MGEDRPMGNIQNRGVAAAAEPKVLALLPG